MFERANAIHFALRNLSPGTVANALQAGFTAAAVVGAAAWLINVSDGTDPILSANAGARPSTSVQNVAVPSREPVFEPFIQDTMFIVGSEQEADLLRALLVEDAALRDRLGLAPVHDNVQVATTDAEAQALAATHREDNRDLVAQSLPEVRLVNLRTP